MTSSKDVMVRHARLFKTEDWAPRMHYVDVPANEAGMVGIRAEVFVSLDGCSQPKPSMRANNRVFTLRYAELVQAFSQVSSPDGKSIVTSAIPGQTTNGGMLPNGSWASTRDLAVCAANEKLALALDDEARAAGLPWDYMLRPASTT